MNDNIIKNRRLEIGATMKEVADYVGVSEATVSRWESGNIANMKRDKIKKLSIILKISPLDILGLSDDESTEADSELSQYLEELKSRPEQRMLFSLTKDCTKEEVMQAVRIIEALRKKDD